MNVEYEYDLTIKDAIEFNCNNDLNRYEYYASHRKEKFSSLNLDERYNLNSFSKHNIIEENKYKKEIDSLIEITEEINDNKLNEYENLSYRESDNSILSYNSKIFDSIDKSFSNLLSKISYSINSELFKLNLLKKFISEDTFKSLSTDSYITKHPHPFVHKYGLNPENISINKNKYSDIYLFTINNVELEFNNINLAIRRNNINELKNKFRLLNKKEKYWKNKEISLNS